MSAVLKSGLVSVSFRGHKPEQIIDLCTKAQIIGVEWAGIPEHVAPGDIQQAERVRKLMLDSGLEVAAYGSYYRAGVSHAAEFDPVLDSACALGAPAIRIWAGHGPNHYPTEQDKLQVVSDIERICELADRHGVRICTEKHGGTLTHPDTTHAWLLSKVKHSALRTLWQPPHHMSTEGRLQSLNLCLPTLENLHVFHWHPNPEDKQALEKGTDDWTLYLTKASGYARYALLEFFIEDSPQQFLKDAATLHQLLSALPSHE